MLNILHLGQEGTKEEKDTFNLGIIPNGFVCEVLDEFGVWDFGLGTSFLGQIIMNTFQLYQTKGLIYWFIGHWL